MSKANFKTLATLSLPSRSVAAFIGNTKLGFIPANKTLLANSCGLSVDECSIGIGELMHHGFLMRIRCPASRYQKLVLHPSLCRNDSILSSLYFKSFGGVYAERDKRAARKAIERLEKR